MPVRDTQTHRQTDRQTRLKIRALQVCNRANNDDHILGAVGGGNKLCHMTHSITPYSASTRIAKGEEFGGITVQTSNTWHFEPHNSVFFIMWTVDKKTYINNFQWRCLCQHFINWLDSLRVLNLTYVSAYLQNISNIGDFCRISLLNKTQNTLFWPTHRLWNGTWSLVPRHICGQVGYAPEAEKLRKFQFFLLK